MFNTYQDKQFAKGIFAGCRQGADGVQQHIFFRAGLSSLISHLSSGEQWKNLILFFSLGGSDWVSSFEKQHQTNAEFERMLKKRYAMAYMGCRQKGTKRARITPPNRRGCHLLLWEASLAILWPLRCPRSNTEGTTLTCLAASFSCVAATSNARKPYSSQQCMYHRRHEQKSFFHQPDRQMLLGGSMQSTRSTFEHLIDSRRTPLPSS